MSPHIPITHIAVEGWSQAGPNLNNVPRSGFLLLVAHLERQHLVEDGLPLFLGLLFGLGDLDLFAKLADLGGNCLFLGHLGVGALHWKKYAT